MGISASRLSIVVFACTRIVAAQDAPALVPSSFAAPVGARVELTLRDGKAPDVPLAWDDAQVAWSFIRVAGTQENSDRAPRIDENAPPGTVRFATEGAAVVGVDFKPRTITLDGAAMRKLTETAGRRPAPPDIKPPEGGAFVRVIQSTKTIIRIGASEPGQSANVTAKTGQQVELRPIFDPTGIGIGSDIPVVVYAGDGKVPGARLTAMHVASGEKHEFEANASAIGSFRLSRAGGWRVEFRQLTEARGDAEKKDGASWVLYTATLTFEAHDWKVNEK